LVEDDRPTAAVLQKILARQGCQVDVAASLAEALPRLGPQVDWVLLDLMLPDGDGALVLETIRARRLSIRVAVTTGVCDDAWLQRVRDLGAEAVLCKPIDLTGLLQHLGLGP
jgi:DNA-binding response OmpR family regulator